MARSSRSPAYPSLSLPKAIEKIREFYQLHKRYPVKCSDKQPDAYKAVGYNSPNGAAKRTIAALLAFGLLEKVGDGTGNEVRISDRGYKILVLPKEDVRELIQQSVREPNIYDQLLNQFPEGLPESDQGMRTFLINRGFNPDSTKSLIANFRESIEFAGLEYDTGTSDEATERREAEQETTEYEGRSSPKSRASGSPGVPHQPQMTSYSIPIPGGSPAILQVPSLMSSKAYDFLITFVKLMRDAEIGGQVSDEVKSKTETCVAPSDSTEEGL